MQNFKKDFIFTSEYVSSGHPDKIADQISDLVLDHILKKFPKTKTAVETMIINQKVFIAGEVSYNLQDSDINEIKNIIKYFLLNDRFLAKYFKNNEPEVQIFLNLQSPDINFLVDNSYNQESKKDDIGAGDQGMMFGYASNENNEFMPSPIYFAKKILDSIFKPEIVFDKNQLKRNDGFYSLINESDEISSKINSLGPDAKSQVCVEYKDFKPFLIKKILISIQHPYQINYKEIKSILLNRIKSVIPNELISSDTDLLINPAGNFMNGGPFADTGLTGRKIIVDTYGGFISHGGGAFSGKDPTKLDRSGAYMARYIAKNLVASKICERCLVSISYTIGISEPFSFSIDTCGTINSSISHYIKDSDIEREMQKIIDLRPSKIIEKFDMWNINFLSLSQNGHFGSNEQLFEKIDLVEKLNLIFFQNQLNFNHDKIIEEENLNG